MNSVFRNCWFIKFTPELLIFSAFHFIQSKNYEPKLLADQLVSPSLVPKALDQYVKSLKYQMSSIFTTK